ncbi:MAG: rhomboid family intramembrane serine protease [Eubacterium sp.]|nr:rhomboid family intramembrane serine protease [Eubacterium sp.]
MEEKTRYIPYMTIILVAANLLVFFYTEFTGGSGDTAHMIDMGAIYEPLVLEEGQWWRLINHFFLHFGFEHILNNMVSLLVLGYALEEKMGKLLFTVFYFLCGILAGVASIVYNVYVKGEYAVSAGASGAIYGLMGGLLVLLIVSYVRKKIRGQGIIRYLIYIALSLYTGSQDPSIDNAAHLGGFVVGFVLCFLMTRLKKMEVSYES